MNWVNVSLQQVYVADLPIIKTTILYPVIGGIIGKLAVVGFVVMAIWAIVVGRKATRIPKSQQASSLP